MATDGAELDTRLRAYLSERVREPGERLPAERWLAERFGVSRPTMRRCLQRLADDGVVEIRERSGVYLAGPDQGELLAVRERLEPYAAALAATNADATQRAALTGLAERAGELVADPEAFTAADSAVHATVVEACGNAVLAGVLASLRRAADFGRRTTGADEPLRERTAARLAELARAVAAGDADAAGAAMTAHLADVRAVWEARVRRVAGPADG